MAIELGGNKNLKVRPHMNVTPLVDVVLVLLIIFMVITPLMHKQLSVNVPIKPDEQAEPPAQASEPQVVLNVDERGDVFINHERVTTDELATKLRRIFAVRSDQTLFFDAADTLRYGRAIEVLDIARGAEIMTIAVLTEPITRH